MMYPLFLDLAADGIPARLTCGVLGFSPQAFYKWRANPVSDRDLDDACLTNALIDANVEDPEFGYRFPKAVAASGPGRRSTTIS
jgi:putative transposase